MIESLKPFLKKSVFLYCKILQKVGLHLLHKNVAALNIL